MPDSRFEIHYTPADVASAQRTRFLRSNQLKVILILWLLIVLFFAVPLIAPGLFPNSQSSSWALVLQVSLAFFVTLFVLLFITPYLDFFFNRFWRLKLMLRFSEKHMRVTVGDKPKGFRLQWNEIQRVEENKRVFILFYGSGGKFFILPKSTFAHAEDGGHSSEISSTAEKRFRDYLARRATIPAYAEDEEEEAVKDEKKEPKEKTG